MKFPFVKFYTGDWFKDTQLASCSPSTRGIWADMLFAMHENGRSGILKGTIAELCQICRCRQPDMESSLTQLKNSKTAYVTVRNNFVTVINRRMNREHKEREAIRLRVLRHRRNGDVTEYVTVLKQVPLRVRSQNKDKDKALSNTPPGGGKAFQRRLPPMAIECVTRLQACLGDRWENDKIKWCDRACKQVEKCERVASEVESAIKEKRINTTPAQYAEQIWKEFE